MEATGSVKTIAVLTSGGDAPGMNAAIRAVVRKSMEYGFKVYGVMRGYQGLFDEDFRRLRAGDVADIIQMGGTILYTARCHEMTAPGGVRRAAEALKKKGIDSLIVIGGDGTFRGALEMAEEGINVIGIPCTIDNDIACTDYTIGFDSALNTVVQAVDKIRDTARSHERCSVIEVMGRDVGYIALWSGLASGAESILLPESYDNNEERLIQAVRENHKKGKRHHIIVNAEGVGHSAELAQKIEKATGIVSRASVLGYMQRGGAPTATDRIHASIMGARAVELLAEGKSRRVICYRGGQHFDMAISEGLAMQKALPEEMLEVAYSLARRHRRDDEE